VGREAICLLFFPLLLQLAFVFPGIAVGTQGFVDCVYTDDLELLSSDSHDNLQVAGAALIGTYESANKDPSVPNSILLAGLAIQLASFAVFLVVLAFCIAKFSRLPIKDSAGVKKSMGLFAWLTAIGILVQLRTAFRLAETAQNVFGYLSTHEVYFGCLEYLPIILAVAGLLWLSERMRHAALVALSAHRTEMSPVSVSSPV
jgi:hypothetical protein